MSHFARGMWAVRRRLDAAGLRLRNRAMRRGAGTGHRDAGFGIIEAVVSIALLAIVVLPVTRLVVTTQAASNNLHLRAEAADLATQALETAQYQTANGVNPSVGITTSTQYSGNDPFTVSVDWELAVGAGASPTVCIASAGQPSSRIWTVKATVSWGRTPSQKGQVTMTTLVSPALADLADTNAAEIAVPIFNADDSTLETTTAIPISVTGQCTGSQCGAESIPGNEVTSESGNSGTTGCAVFANLFAGAGWSYTVNVSPPSPYVDPNEYSDAPTATQAPVRTVQVQPNTVSPVTNPNIILAQGELMTVNFNTINFVSGSNDGTVKPAPYLPFSVSSSTLLCSSPAPQTCVMGDGTAAGGFSYASPQTALLYPGLAVTGTTPNSSAWVGDQADSSPGFQDANGDAVYGSDVATNFQALPNAVGTLTLPVYPLALKLTINSDAKTVTAMAIADAAGGDTFSLYGTTGSTFVSGQTTTTGVPLGEFQIKATVSSGGNSTVSPTYVWVMPTGVCTSSNVNFDPTACTPSTSAVSVTIG